MLSAVKNGESGYWKGEIKRTIKRDKNQKNKYQTCKLRKHRRKQMMECTQKRKVLCVREAANACRPKRQGQKGEAGRSHAVQGARG